MALAGFFSGQGLALLVLPGASPGSQLFEQTFRSRNEFLHMTIRFRTEVGTIEDRDLEKNLGPVPPLGREHHAMSGGIRMFARLEQVQRLEEHAAETPEVPKDFPMLRIIAERQMAGILKGGVEIELKPDLDDVASPVFDVEGVMIETDLSLNDHLVQGLLARKCAFQIEWNGHR